jgi:hypothetical protein
VRLTYDASNIIFLPTHWRLPYIQVDLPSSLPSYQTWLATE